MSTIVFQKTAWYHAINLPERAASLRTTGGKAPADQINTRLAENRLQQWQSQAPFADDGYFDRRLEMDHLTQDDLTYLLGEPIESVRGRYPAPPVWLANLERAFTRSAVKTIALPEGFRDQEAIGFLNLIEPLVVQARARVQEEAQRLFQTHPGAPFDPDTVEEVLLANLPGRLFYMLSRTLVLELHVARLQGLLHGQTAEERFQSFAERLRQREAALTILQEYPVLARQLAIRIDQWVNFSLEFLRHLCADWADIQNMFSSQAQLGSLVALDGGVGDRHRDGRTVMIAGFASGLRLVYKPKSLAVETHFQELLTWLNQRGDHPPFRTLTILDRATHGWVEFVTPQGCASPDQVRRFYERQGGYLALLYALEATDFHYENLIAAGEHPVPVDLESLFHPRVEGIDTRQSEAFVGRTMMHSVLRTGLLPQRIWASEESEGVDLSGLGMLPGQLSPQGVPQWDSAGTDQMRFTREHMEMPGGRNRPTLNDQDVNVLDYAQAITNGFERLYRLLLRHRDELLADDGPLAAFAGDEIRVILRATRTYSLLLQESFHPDVLRDALERDCMFDRLWAGVPGRSFLSRVIPAEQADLWRNDVPMFTTHPNSRHLWSSMGEQMADFFDEPGMNLALCRIQQLNEKDLEQQRWFIRASLTALAMGESHTQRPIYPLNEPQRAADRERLLTAARKVGDRLESLALRSEQDVSWIGVTLVNERHWTLMPLAWDLYDGLAGVVLFLAYLGAVTQEERYTILAQDALATLHRQIESAESLFKSVGGFDGWGNLIYTLSHLGVLWGQPELLAEAESFVERLPDLIEQDQALDVLSGAAGCIGSLVSLLHCKTSQRALAVAMQCGDHLIDRAQAMEQGMAWLPAGGVGTKPLVGFSHGAAGIAWALLELAALTGARRYREMAMEAMAYERCLFSPAMGNWPDLREFESSNQAIQENQERLRFMAAWCHGAPGIGLARLRALQHLDDAQIRQEVDIALKTTLAYGFGASHSLCHGDLGNLELLLQASLTLNDPQWHTTTYRLAAAILDSIEEYGWICGVPLGVETPGLMVGLAGIGYELLRLAEPTRVPSVLTLSPPVVRPGADAIRGE
jgi:type 2 lantibiotic biosynthesis protein LanM